MGRPPSNGSPAFRFAQSEVAEMETILQEHNNAMPAREVLIALSEKFSNSTERQGKIVVQMKQVWNWFQNKRYAIRAKSAKAPAKLSVSTLPPAPSLPPVASMQNTAPVSRDDFTPASNVSQAVPAASGRMASDSSPMEFEAKSVRDGAWYDVANFLAIKNLETGDPEVLVRFAGFGQEEDEWVNVKKHVRQRSLPCESSECVVVLPGDLILCFQEGKEQALYFDAHVLDAQRRRHDVRGCRCRFLVRYDHDQSEEIVPLRKICRRPETDYRLQQLHTVNESATADPQKTGSDPSMGNTTRVTNSQSESAQIPLKPEENVGAVAGMNPAANANANANALQAPIALANADVFAAPNTTQVPISPAKPYIPATNSTTEAPVAPTSTNVPAVNSTAQAPISPANANVPATTKTISQELKTSETGSVSDTGNSDVPPSAAPLMGESGIGTVTSSITENVSEGKE